MTDDRAIQAALIALMLMLPIGALAARRVAWWRGLLLAGAWILIFAVATLIALAVYGRLELT